MKKRGKFESWKIGYELIKRGKEGREKGEQERRAARIYIDDLVVREISEEKE